MPRDMTGKFHTIVALERRITKPAFDLIVSKYYARTNHAGAHFPKRRIKVTFEVDSDWALLYLGSAYAYFEHEEPVPPNLITVHQRFIEVKRPPEVGTKFYKFTYVCYIWYQINVVGFSTGHGSLGTTDKSGNTRVKAKFSYDSCGIEPVNILLPQ